LDGHFRTEADHTWNFSRIEWLRQVSEEMANLSLDQLVGECTILKLQQTILRASLDWDELCNTSLSKNDEHAPLVVQALMHWTRCQFLIWNSNDSQWSRWCLTDWAAPIIFIHWNGERYSPIVWLDGIPETQEPLRPFPSQWVLPWLTIWGLYPHFDEPEVQQEVEPEVQQEVEPEVQQEVEPEVQQEVEQKVQQEVRELNCKGWKKQDWQKFADQSGISFQKPSEKTGKMIQKTIDELRDELESIGFHFKN
jgi:hypothetical protein